MKLMGKVAAPTMLPVGFGMKFQDYVFRESSLTLDENRIMGRLGHLCGELANVVTEMNLRNLMERLTLEEKELLVHVSGGVDLGEGTLSAFEGVRGEFLGGIVTK